MDVYTVTKETRMKAQITLTGGNHPISLSFKKNQDGTVMLEISDDMGAATCHTYLANRPDDLVHEGRVYQSPQGVLIQTGIVIRQDGTGRGVAWRIAATR